MDRAEYLEALAEALAAEQAEVRQERRAAQEETLARLVRELRERRERQRVPALRQAWEAARRQTALKAR